MNFKPLTETSRNLPENPLREGIEGKIPFRRNVFPLLGIVFFALIHSPAQAFVIDFSEVDFDTVTPAFSSVSTFNFNIDVDSSLTKSGFADPSINTIEYNVNGTLAPDTPSGFPAFVFQLSHLVAPFPAPPTTIPGTVFYQLNGDAAPGQTLRFEVSDSANLSDGLQIDELQDLGDGVVFRFNGRETGTDGRPGRYHPAFLELKSDGTGLFQNADNKGGINPSTSETVDVAFGEEYMTDLTFDPSTFTIAIPEPGTLPFVIFVTSILVWRRRTPRR